MFAYGNNIYLDLQSLKNPSGDFIDTTDEIKRKFIDAWKELDERYWSRGMMVTFKTPSIVSGHGNGSRGYSCPRAVTVKTKKQGKVPVWWYDEMVEEGGRKVYKPVSLRVGVTEKTMQFGPDEIEKAIWLFAFSPFTIRTGNPSGKTYIEDLEADARKYAETEQNAAVVSYWLYRGESVFYNSDAQINTLCLAYGINPEHKSIEYRKMLLAEAVKKAERKGDLEFGLNGFNSMCEKLKDGNDTKHIEIAALAQRAQNERVIRYNDETFKWVLLGEDGKSEVKTICKVPPQSTDKAKVILRQYLMGAPDDVATIVSALAVDEPTKYDRVTLSAPLPDDQSSIDENFLRNDLGWPDRKALYQFCTGKDTRGKTDEVIIPAIINYFVVQKRTVLWDIKKKK